MKPSQRLNEISSSKYALLTKGGVATILVLGLGGGGWYLLSPGPQSSLACGPTEIETPQGCLPKPVCGPLEVETPNGCIPQAFDQPQLIPDLSAEERESVQRQQEVDELKDKIQALEKMGEEMADLKTRLTQLENDLTHQDDEAETVFNLKQQIAQLDETITQKLANNVPNCLSKASQALKKKLPVQLVPTLQERSVPQHLHPWIKGMNHAIINEPAFFIMRREVTVGEFQQYVESLNDSQPKKFGKAWRQAQNQPVASISWEAARDYAVWLSHKTGCSLALPTYNQWVAAVIRYAKPTKAILRDTTMTLEPRTRQDSELDSVLDLLGNVREWSKESEGCSDGSHSIFGGDYKTWRDNIKGEPICESSILDTIGFRLVLLEQE